MVATSEDSSPREVDTCQFLASRAARAEYWEATEAEAEGDRKFFTCSATCWCRKREDRWEVEREEASTVRTDDTSEAWRAAMLPYRAARERRKDCAPAEVVAEAMGGRGLRGREVPSRG
jgi:hypothetical protein